MKDIELAIQKEQEYIEAVINMKDGEVRPELLDYISLAGYDDISEFHQDKEEYRFSKVVFRDWELTSDEITYHLSDICEELASNEENAIFYNIDMDRLSAFVPSNFNKEDIAKEIGVQPIYGKYYSKRDHGIIVTGNQDLKFAISVKVEDYNFCLKIKDKVIEYLSKYYDNVVYTGNDILINDKKVAGFATRTIGNMAMAMFNLSFHDYLYYIDKLCKYDKTPGYIDNPDISARKVLFEIKSILNLN